MCAGSIAPIAPGAPEGQSLPVRSGSDPGQRSESAPEIRAAIRLFAVHALRNPDKIRKSGRASPDRLPLGLIPISIDARAVRAAWPRSR